MSDMSINKFTDNTSVFSSETEVNRSHNKFSKPLTSEEKTRTGDVYSFREKPDGSEFQTYTSRGTIQDSYNDATDAETEPATLSESSSREEADKKTEATSEARGETSPKEESELTENESQELKKLKARDSEVKTHEQAHVASGGQYVTKAATFDYETGPDGKRYAVGGEVSISVSEVPNDPQATINKMQTVKRAALAPASPSAQDRAVATKATRIEMNARAEATATQLSEQNAPSEASTDPEEKNSISYRYSTNDFSAESHKGNSLNISV